MVLFCIFLISEKKRGEKREVGGHNKASNSVPVPLCYSSKNPVKFGGNCFIQSHSFDFLGCFQVE